MKRQMRHIFNEDTDVGLRCTTKVQRPPYEEHYRVIHRDLTVRLETDAWYSIELRVLVCDHVVTIAGDSAHRTRVLGTYDTESIAIRAAISSADEARAFADAQFCAPPDDRPDDEIIAEYLERKHDEISEDIPF